MEKLMKAYAIFLTVLFPFTALADGSIQVAVKLSPAGSFVAKSEKLKGDIAKNGDVLTASKISIAIDSFKTGMSLRDEHFCKHLGCEAHPKAVLTQLKASKGKGTATLELNGVKKEISFNYEEKAGVFTSKLQLNASDFNMPQAKYLGVEVNNQVVVEIKIGAPAS
jgi:hypothetical protein